MKHFEDIKDDEIRIISRQEVKRKPLYRRWWFWAAIAAAAVLLAVILALSIRHQAIQPADVEETTVESAPLSPTMEQTGTARVLVRDTAINDVPLRLQTPVNAVPDTTGSGTSRSASARDLGCRAASRRITSCA